MAASDTPIPLSYNQTVGGMIDTFASKTGIDRLKVGGPLLSVFETAAQNDVRASQDVWNMLKSTSLDNSTGIGLERIGRGEEVFKLVESPSSGFVDISDSSFQKISTKVYHGTAAPIVGSSKVDVADASTFPSTGQIYIGRGTNNYEGPLSYTSTTNNGTYWSINLAATTLRFHNHGESVILAQGGNRVIGTSVVVRTPQGNVSTSVEFGVLHSAIIPDGDVIVQNVLVICKQPGAVGNVGAKAIREFASAPFSGAQVINPLPFTNAISTESDDDYRQRIRDERNSRAKATPLALTSSVIGVISTEENKTIISSSLVSDFDGSATLYVDDGTGYEEAVEGVAFETLADFANGGEDRFQVSQRPVSKARLTSTLQAPFVLMDGLFLSIVVGGHLTEHRFATADFKAIDNASAFEVASSINANPALGFVAKVTDGGSRVTITARETSNEDLLVVTPSVGVSLDANAFLGLPTSFTQTMWLYKNDRLLQKDGVVPTLESEPIDLWGAMVAPQTIVLDVDGTGPATYTFVDQDFIDADTGFLTLGVNTVQAWAKVFNLRIPGITATTLASSVVLRSNLGADDRASLEILDTSSLVANNVFQASSSQGSASDYSLVRPTGQIKLVEPLAAGDKLTAGTQWPRAFLESPTISPTTLSADGNLWFGVDAKASIVLSGVGPSTDVEVAASAVESWGYRTRITATSPTTPFSNLLKNDWAIFWGGAWDSSLLGMWRICNVDPATNKAWFEIERASTNAARAAQAAAKYTLSGNEQVLVAGGFLGWDLQDGSITAHAEIFDINSLTWTPTAPMAVARAYHTLTRLSDDRVLVVGGRTNTGTATAAVEIYDPSTGLWTTKASIPTPRYRHTANLLNDGTVLVVGGRDHTGAYFGSTYIYDPIGNTWTSAGAISSRAGHIGTKVTPSGNVVVAGGEDGISVLNTGHMYNFGAGLWTATATMNVARQAHAALKESTDQFVYVTGGSANLDSAAPANLATTEYYDSVGDTWTGASSMNFARSYHGMVQIFGSTDMYVGWGHLDTPATDAKVERIAGTFIFSFWTVVPNPLGTFSRILPSMIAVEPVGDQFFAFNGYDAGNTKEPIAAVESYLGPGDAGTWIQPDPAFATSIVVGASSNIEFARTEKQLFQATIPAATNYTATSFASALDGAVKGADAATYRTSQLRFSTNTLAVESPGVPGGDVALVGADAQGQLLTIPESSFIANVAGHAGSVESSRSGLGTPDFAASIVRAEQSLSEVLLLSSGGETSVNRSLVGLKNLDDAVLPTALSREGTNHTFSSFLALATSSEDVVDVTLDEAAPQRWLPEDRVYFAWPYSIGPADDLSILVDQDEDTKDFPINMFRTLKSASTSYAAVNTFKDHDAGDVSMAVTFGVAPGFSFDDFVAYMRARRITHPGTPSKSILWRYYRFGPDGNAASVKYVYPSGPNQVAVVTVENSSHLSVAAVGLGSGALKTGYTIRPTTKIGCCLASLNPNNVGDVVYILGYSVPSSARNGAGTQTTLTLTLPAGVTDHGLVAGDLFYLNSNDVNFPSGLYSVISATATTIVYADPGVALQTGTNIGTVSRDVGEATLVGTTPALAVGDYFRLGVNGLLPDAFVDTTIRIAAFGNQFVRGFSENPDLTLVTTGTVNWQPLNDTALFQLFINSAQTANAIAAAVNAQAAAANTKSSVTAKVLGSGLGIIDTATFEEEMSAGVSYQLEDGVNYIKATTAPVLISGDYQLEFKETISSNLAGTGSDWLNDLMIVAPAKAEDVARWLMVPAASGFFSVGKAELSSHAEKVQLSTLTPGSVGSIQVKGGVANEAVAPAFGSTSTFVDGGLTYGITVVRKGDVAGIFAGTWASIDNANALPKPIFASNTILNSWDSSGNLTFDSGTAPMWTYSAGATANLVAQVEKQGRFVALVNTNLGMFPDWSLAKEGDWIRVALPATPTVGVGQVALANQGIFRVVRVVNNPPDLTSKTVWIENPNAVEQAIAECDVFFYEYASVMPGDVLAVSHDLWLFGNKGNWTVAEVDWTNRWKFRVDVGVRSPAVVTSPTAALGAQVGLAQIVEAMPTRLIKQVRGISPNQDDGTYADLKWEPGPLATFNLISEAAGSVVNALDKLEFPGGIYVGQDGYEHFIGLIQEANKVVQGDPTNPTLFPGVAAQGAKVEEGGPFVKRVIFGVSARLLAGVSKPDAEDQIRSTAAAFINQSPLGKPIAISKLLAAINKIPGVQALGVTFPTFDSLHDLIPVQPFEKPYVLDAQADISVSFVGG